MTFIHHRNNQPGILTKVYSCAFSKRYNSLYFDRIVFQGELENDDLEYSRRRRLLYSPEDKNDSKLMIITRRICISPLFAEIKFSTFSTRQHGLRRSHSIDFEAKFP